MRLRDATDEDIPAVLDMARAFYESSDQDTDGPFDAAHTLGNIAGIRHAGFLLVVENGGNLVGMLGALFAPGICSPRLRCMETCLWVNPGHRAGTGLLMLVREFDRRATAAGVGTAQLSMLANSPPALARIFERMGYGLGDTTFTKRFGGH
jgi:hypothetical protein